PAERERHGDLPPAHRVFQRRDFQIPPREGKSVRHGEPHLHPRGDALDEAERAERTVHHYQRVGYGGSRAHPASLEEQHWRREESYHVYRLLRGAYVRRANPLGREPGEHFRRAATGAREG